MSNKPKNKRVSLKTLIDIAKSGGDTVKSEHLNDITTTIIRWIQDVDLMPGTLKVKPIAAYNNYKEWCSKNNVDENLISTLERFGMFMSERYPKVRLSTGRHYKLNQEFKYEPKEKKKN